DVGTSKTITCARIGVLKGFTNYVSATAKAGGKTLHVNAVPVVVRVALKRS
ncbi:MAG: hypothetical protein JO064_10805, partial [Actinobacteria bacterium]|nr:hypothetical protein [Actinomycetota bacterium]